MHCLDKHLSEFGILQINLNNVEETEIALLEKPEIICGRLGSSLMAKP